MQMIVFRSRDGRQTIGWPYELANEVASHFMVGDYVTLTFLAYPSFIQFRLYKPGFPDSYENKQAQGTVDDAHCEIRVCCQVVARDHDLVVDKGKAKTFREYYQTIVLEPVTVVDENTLATITEQLIQIPEGDEIPSESRSKTAMQLSGNQEPALADGAVEQADGIPIREVLDFLVFAGDVVGAVLDFFPETQKLSIRQLYDAIMRAHERYESVGVMELAQVAHEMLKETEKS